MHRSLGKKNFILLLILLSFSIGCFEEYLTCPENYELTENELCRPLDTRESSDAQAGNSQNPGQSDKPQALPVPPYVSEAGLNQHILSLMAIASEHNNNRAIGTSGYEASVTYVANYLEEAGYDVTFQEFPYETYEFLGDPELEQIDSDTNLEFETDFVMLGYSGTGDATGVIQAIDLQIPPSEERNTSTSGCEPEDFESFVNGAIALIQRGSCTFATKAANAQAAGASAVLIFNEGQEGRKGLFAGTLDPDNPVSIPVFGLTYSAGSELIAEPGQEIEIRINSNIRKKILAVHNVLVEYPGLSEHVWMLGAHLDSVPEGPGINDNGTGVASLLEIAKQLSQEQPPLAHGVRFAFWGAEEVGLVGSLHYVRELPAEERTRILGYLNFDMIGSPNPGRYIYDGDGSTFSLDIDVPPGSGAIEQAFIEHFNTYQMPHAPTQLDGRSDYHAFTLAGIPAGGLFTGANDRMSGRDAGLFDGQAGSPFDPCYHQSCDKTENVNMRALHEMTNAAAYTLLTLMENDAFPSSVRGVDAVQSVTSTVHKPQIPSILPGNCHHAIPDI